MSEGGFFLFPTAIGHCGIAWRGGKLLGVQLPEHDEAATRARLARRHPDCVEREPEDREVGQVVEEIVALLAGERRDFAGVELDFGRAADFERRVYAAAMSIPIGATRTYGEIARQCGEPSAAQAVGRALGRNPFPIVVPCHRVLAAGGRIGGFSANGGIDTKRRILAIESRHAQTGPTLFDLPGSP